MQFKLAALLTLLPLALAAPSAEIEERSYNTEWKTLGCPKTTKPYADEREQLAAVSGFANTLFVEQNATKAFNTWVAEDLINHAPDAAGDGRATAYALIGPRIETHSSIINIQKIFSGQSYGTIFFKAIAPQLGTGAIMEIFRLSGTCLVGDL
jgi:hypothetical protein